MRRTQIQLDELTFAAVRQRAFQGGRSMSAVIREVLASALKVGRTPAAGRIGDLTFVGAVRSGQRPGRPVSEDHDAALADAAAIPSTRRRR